MIIPYDEMNKRHEHEIMILKARIDISSYKLHGKFLNQYNFPEDFIFRYDYNLLDSRDGCDVWGIQVCAYARGSDKEFLTFIAKGYIPPEIISALKDVQDTVSYITHNVPQDQQKEIKSIIKENVIDWNTLNETQQIYVMNMLMGSDNEHK